jgi:hypothetical protein
MNLSRETFHRLYRLARLGCLGTLHFSRPKEEHRYWRDIHGMRLGKPLGNQRTLDSLRGHLSHYWSIQMGQLVKIR